MRKQLYTYEKWGVAGMLGGQLKAVQEMVYRRLIQKDIAWALNINEKPLTKL
ncbi:MAG: hypothetical protein Q8M70_07540 [bacterium]|nr:hypothetical protein [bacterium]